MGIRGPRSSTYRWDMLNSLATTSTLRARTGRRFLRSFKRPNLIFSPSSEPTNSFLPPYPSASSDYRQNYGFQEFYLTGHFLTPNNP